MFTKELLETELHRLRNMNFDKCEEAEVNALVDICNTSELLADFLATADTKPKTFGAFGAFIAGLKIGLHLQKENDGSMMN